MLGKIPFNFQAYFYFKKPTNKIKMLFFVLHTTKSLKNIYKNHIF